MLGDAVTRTITVHELEMMAFGCSRCLLSNSYRWCADTQEEWAHGHSCEGIRVWNVCMCARRRGCLDKPCTRCVFSLLRVPFSTLGLQANDWSDRILNMYAGSHAVVCRALLGPNSSLRRQCERSESGSSDEFACLCIGWVVPLLEHRLFALSLRQPRLGIKIIRAVSLRGWEGPRLSSCRPGLLCLTVSALQDGGLC